MIRRVILIYAMLAITLASSAFATPGEFMHSGYYWGIAKLQGPEDGPSTSAFVIGKRIAKNGVVTEYQHYVTATIPSEEYSYRFDFNEKDKKKNLTVFFDGKEVAKGSFEYNHKTGECDYSYEIPGKNGYSATGKDVFRKTGLAFIEKSTVKYPHKPKAETWVGEFLPINEEMYTKLRRKF